MDRKRGIILVFAVILIVLITISVSAFSIQNFFDSFNRGATGKVVDSSSTSNGCDYSKLPVGFTPVAGYYHKFGGGRINLWDANGNLYICNGDTWFDRTGTQISLGLPETFIPLVGYYSKFNKGRINLWDADGSLYEYNSITSRWIDRTGTQTRLGLPSTFKPVAGYYHEFGGGRINLWDASGNLYIYGSGNGWIDRTGTQTRLGLPSTFKPVAGYYYNFTDIGARIDLFDASGNLYSYDGLSWIDRTNTLAEIGFPAGRAPIAGYFDEFKQAIILWYSGSEAWSSDDGINFERVELSSEDNPESDISISLATTKRHYNFGENIELTDPPKENLEGNSLGPQSSSIEGGFESRDVEIEGYIVQLTNQPVIEKEIELNNKLKKLAQSSSDYAKKSQEAFFLTEGYYQIQSDRKKSQYENIKQTSSKELSDLKQTINEEHARFLDSAKEIIGAETSNSQKIGAMGSSNANSKIKKEFNYIFNGYVLDISEKEAKVIEKLDGVKKVYPNYKVKVNLDSSISAMDFDLFKDYEGLDGEGVTIAVIDTGIDATHKSLDDLDDDPNTNNPKIIGWMDYVNFRTEPYDDHGHGTHVSGIATGTGGSSNYKGVAPKANLVGVKVLDSYGGGSFSDVIAGIEWTIQHKDEYHISIISMSLGANVNSDGTSPVEIAADYAVESGINFVVAAGNAGGWGANTVGIPASAKDVITVGAVDDNLDIAYFSSRGPTKDGRLKPEVSAVGVDVTSSIPGNKYDEWSGTSMATPHVAGFVALLLQQNPSLSPEQVKEIITNSALDKGIAGPDNDYGYGVISGLDSISYLNPPEHEIALTNLESTNYLILNQETKINAEVKNYGANTEDIELKLLVDNREIETKIVRILQKETKLIEFNYIETAEGKHNIVISVPVISGELISNNNDLSKEITGVIVSGTIKAVVVDSWGNYKSEYTLFDELENNWIDYGSYLIDIDYQSLKKQDITYEDIVATGADVLILSNAWANGNYGMYLQYTDSEIQAIKRYVEEGHGLIGTSGTLSELVPNNIKLAELFGLENNIGLWNDNEAAGGDAIWDKTMDVLVEDDLLTKNIPVNYQPYYATILNLADDKTKGTVRVAEVKGREDVFVSAYKPVLGASVYFTNMVEYDDVSSIEKQFFYNSLVWTKNNIGNIEKDILIYDLQMVEKSRLNQEVLISAKIKNNGANLESNININLLADGVIKETKTINSLASNQEQTISFSFIPNEIKQYTINLEVVPLTGETYLINNKLRKNLLVPRLLMDGDNKDYLIDLGNDGKYDYLAVSLGVDVFKEDHYNIQLDLESYLGVQLYPEFSQDVDLKLTNTNITVLIPLQTIKRYGLNGPYRVKNIKINSYNRDYYSEVDSNEAGFITGAYRYIEFRDPAQVIQESFSDYAVDTNENGLYNNLIINFSVNIPVAGNYWINGYLSGIWGYNNFYFSQPGIYEANLTFSGIDLRREQLDGPYILERLEIQLDSIESMLNGEIYTTNPYSYEDFESFNNVKIGWSYLRYIIVGESSQIIIPMYNGGTDDFGEFNLNLYYNDALIGTNLVNGIPLNSFAESIFDYTPVDFGYLQFKAEADIIDDNLNDNSAEFSIRSYASRGADLEIYPDVWDSVYVIGEESEIDFNIIVGGTGEDAENVKVNLYSVEWEYDEDRQERIEKLTLIGTKSLGDISAEEYVRDSIDYTPVSKYNQLKIEVEADNEIFPGDNTRYFHINAKMQGADLSGDFMDYNLNLVVGTNNLIPISVINKGTESAEDVFVDLFSVEYNDNGEQLTLIGRHELAELLSDAPQEFSFVYVPNEDVVGNWQSFKANISCINEVDSSDNELSFSKLVAPQSKITNNGIQNVLGDLSFEIRKMISENTYALVDGTNHNFNVEILAGNLIKLDELFNPLQLSIDQEGDYQVCANFEYDNQNKESCWNFYVY